MCKLSAVELSPGFCIAQSMDDPIAIGEDGNSDIIESSTGKALIIGEGASSMEPYVGMEFESEEAAKVFYDAYATHLGFIMRVDAFRRSMRDGKVVWRRLVCNKEGFRKLRSKRSENRKPRAITREGCKAMIVAKKEKTGKWVVTRFIKEHNHPLVVTPSNNRRSVVLSQTPVWFEVHGKVIKVYIEDIDDQEKRLGFGPFGKAKQDTRAKDPVVDKPVKDDKDVKIRELTAELQRERKRSAALQEQLEMVLRDMEEHCNYLSRNIDDVVQSVREIESQSETHP